MPTKDTTVRLEMDVKNALVARKVHSEESINSVIKRLLGMKELEV